MEKQGGEWKLTHASIEDTTATLLQGDAGPSKTRPGSPENVAIRVAPERGGVDGTEPSPSDEPVLETLEECERYYQEVNPTTVIIRVDLRRNRATCTQ